MDEIRPNLKNDPEVFCKASLWNKSFAFLFCFFRNNRYIPDSKSLYALYTPNRYPYTVLIRSIL